MNEPNRSKERASESFVDKVLEAVGAALGVGLFLLMLWLFGDISSGTRPSASSTGSSESRERQGSGVLANRRGDFQAWNEFARHRH